MLVDTIEELNTRQNLLCIHILTIAALVEYSEVLFCLRKTSVQVFLDFKGK